LEVLEDGERLDLGDKRQRAFLAMLLVEPGRVVSVGRLIPALWAGDPPALAADCLSRFAANLQETLGSEILEVRPRGYRVQLRPGQLDVDRFRVLVDAAERGSVSSRKSKLRQALALWRGPVLADVAGRPFAQASIAELNRLRSLAETRLSAT
jgi:DNA-binding SARP family transcriptional activator